MIGIAVFLVILDLGINAGRIHYGVSIDHLELGSLTELEAVDVLDRRGSQMAQTPITFEREDVRCSFLPDDVGWTPNVRRTVSRALSVGRRGSIWDAGNERIQAWFGGITIKWSDQPNRRKVGVVLDSCQELTSSAGLQLSRWPMRLAIRKALTIWPRRSFLIPVHQ